MTRTMPLATAFGLALALLMFASAGTPPKASVPALAYAATESFSSRDQMEQRAEASARSLLATAPSLATLALRSRLDPLARPIEPPRRPEPRSFWAKGPLVDRVLDPNFGPRLRPSDLLMPKPPATLAEASDLLCMAVAIYHEARSQPLDGQLAVASVILNRSKFPDRWGSSPCAVVAPVQFSFLDAEGRHPPIQDGEAWAIAVEMAREALERGPSPLVGSADHYHTPAVDPEWNQGMQQVIRIDDHIFFVDPTTSG